MSKEKKMKKFSKKFFGKPYFRKEILCQGKPENILPRKFREKFFKKVVPSFLGWKFREKIYKKCLLLRGSLF